MQHDPNHGPDLNDVMGEMSQIFRRSFRKLGPLLAFGLVVLLALAGVYKVDSGSQGVVRRFGKEHRRSGPGLHYAVPVVERVDVVNVEEIRRIEVGFRGDQPLPEEALMLTGDENIVEVRMVVQYRVADPGKFLFRIGSPQETLQSAAEVALRTVVGQSKIDDVMTTGRATVQESAEQLLQKLLDEYQSGIEVTDVKLDSVDAPDEVKDAFNAVTRAREDKERLVNQARGYAEDKVPRARGEARSVEREAEGYREQRILRAQGEVAKFKSVYAEYTKAKDVTRRRLHLETMERVLSNTPEKVLVDEHLLESGNAVLPLLMQGTRAPAAHAMGATADKPADPSNESGGNQ
jgi:membrane protease subunit HflK